jgi:hypothetical protein
MSILVVGDSIAFGLELADLPSPTAGLFGNDYWDKSTDQSIPMRPSQLAWPQLLATDLRQDVDNLSLVGGSNARIHRVAVKQSLVKKYHLVICAWTELSRLDISWQGKECPVSANTTKWPWAKNFFADHYETEQEIERFWTQILTLQSFFKQMQQPYLFVRGCGLAWTPAQMQRSKSLIDTVDLSRCLFWNISMNHFCRDNLLEFGPHGHFLEQGHRAVADKLLDFLKNHDYK